MGDHHSEGPCISKSLALRLLEKIEIEDIIKQSELTEAQALEPSESLKENWWKESKECILAKIRGA